ncbi:Ig-like domain-containing protein [Streptomyces sp. NBC_00237]|uniref:Ig-like domain-containing protein n=1 Tax=Streptomyces sp. NBC_00237 TaxID=2975687 RepID=UPI002257FA0F|nr:Ig-like domain-containing protein [Streptomyces sp. NBC_00237]MCX5201570.1 Ig-like domain-containing protein [Streptomyces sp. NBC_00237]
MFWKREKSAWRVVAIGGAAVLASVVLAGCKDGKFNLSSQSADSVSHAERGVPQSHSGDGTPGIQLVDDARNVDGGRPVRVSVLANDTFTLRGSASKPVLGTLGKSDYVLTLNSEPRHGSVVINGNYITYTPSPAYVGEDEFTYKVAIEQMQGEPVGNPHLESTAVVRITMNTPAVDDKPEQP